MKNASVTGVMSLVFGSLLLAGCSGNTAQLDEARSYLEKVETLTASLENAGTTFETAMSKEGDIDQVAIGSLLGTLQSTIDNLQAIQVEDAEIRASHRVLIQGVQTFRTAVDQLLAAAKDPASAPDDLEKQLDDKMANADRKIDEWAQGIAKLLPADEAEELLE